MYGRPKVFPGLMGMPVVAAPEGWTLPKVDFLSVTTHIALNKPNPNQDNRRFFCLSPGSASATTETKSPSFDGHLLYFGSFCCTFRQNFKFSPKVA